MKKISAKIQAKVLTFMSLLRNTIELMKLESSNKTRAEFFCLSRSVFFMKLNTLFNLKLIFHKYILWTAES